MNPQKRQPMFSLEEREAMLEASVARCRTSRVEHFRGLLADYVQGGAGRVIVKGLRVVSDFESEMSAALINRSLSDVDTLFLMSDQKYSFVSSSMVKEVFFLGGEVAALVPEPVLRLMTEKRTTQLATEVAMSVYRVLDKLEAYVHEGTWLPAGYRILSEERLLELVEKIRASLPEEVGRARTQWPCNDLPSSQRRPPALALAVTELRRMVTRA